MRKISREHLFPFCSGSFHVLRCIFPKSMEKGNSWRIPFGHFLIEIFAFFRRASLSRRSDIRLIKTCFSTSDRWKADFRRKMSFRQKKIQVLDRDRFYEAIEKMTWTVCKRCKKILVILKGNLEPEKWLKVPWGLDFTEFIRSASMMHLLKKLVVPILTTGGFGSCLYIYIIRSCSHSCRSDCKVCWLPGISSHDEE